MNVEDLDAISSFVFGVDDHGEESADLRQVLPTILRDIAKGSVAAAGKLAEEQSGADGSFFYIRCRRIGIFFLGLLFFGRSAMHGQPSALRAEREGFDPVHRG